MRALRNIAPASEVHAGTDASKLGTAGVAVLNFYKNNIRQSQFHRCRHRQPRRRGLGGGRRRQVRRLCRRHHHGAGFLIKIGTRRSRYSPAIAMAIPATTIGARPSPPALFAGADPDQRWHLAVGRWHRGSTGQRRMVRWAPAMWPLPLGAAFAFDRTDITTVSNQIFGRRQCYRQFGTGTTNLSGSNTASTARWTPAPCAALGTDAQRHCCQSAGAAVISGSWTSTATALISVP